MAETAEKSDPKLWDKVKDRVTKGAKGGKPGQWSARKAQLATAAYKKEGGGYKGAKNDDNSLAQWTEENWGTRSGKESGKTGERYLPKEAREHLSKNEYDRTTAKKRKDSAAGKQFSSQPKDVAKKSAKYRHGGTDDAPTKAQLYAEAKKHNIQGRSTMSKAQLQRAVEKAS